MTPTGLLTDKCELTMLSSLLADETAHHPATFETFTRRLPHGRRYAITAGLGRLLPLIHNFTFPHEDITWLLNTHAITPQTADYLTNYHFTGNIHAYPEGETYWPGSPILRVEGTLGESVILETLILSVLNHDSAIASAATRMVHAAQGRPIIEMGSRRVHEQAATAVARAAYLAGFASTSNLAAGRQYGIPTVGTAAHAFTLAHASEREAFASQMRTLGVGTTLLVDTYDIEQGIRTAVEVAQEIGGEGPGAIRIDSGDLATEAHRARHLLDTLGAHNTRITVTSDLDEYVMAALQDAPIDGYGAGTRIATGSGHPTAGLVYKLVAIADTPNGPQRPVAKKSTSKASIGGRKTPYRLPDGTERYSLNGTVPPGGAPVQVLVMKNGTVTAEGAEPLSVARTRTARTLTNLPDTARQISDGPAHFTSEEG